MRSTFVGSKGKREGLGGGTEAKMAKMLGLYRFGKSN